MESVLDLAHLPNILLGIVICMMMIPLLPGPTPFAKRKAGGGETAWDDWEWVRRE